MNNNKKINKRKKEKQKKSKLSEKFSSSDTSHISKADSHVELVPTLLEGADMEFFFVCRNVVL